MSSAAPPTDVEGLLALILKSRLLGRQELSAACSTFLEESSTLGCEPTFETLCEFLISSNRLTTWQCDRLREGRWKGFFLDQYKLLNCFEPDEDFSYYLAEEVATGKHVKMRIIPKSRAPQDGKIRYEVVEL